MKLYQDEFQFTWIDSDTLHICYSVNRALYCIHTKKLSCLKSGVKFDMNDILYEFKNLHHFQDNLTFGVNEV